MSTPEARSTSNDYDEVLLESRIEALKQEVIPTVLDGATELNEWQTEALSVMQMDLGSDQTIDLPTRTGKSHLIRAIAEAAQDQGVRCLIVAHRSHILNEHAQTLAKQNVTTQNLAAESINPSTHVFISSVQSVARRQVDQGGVAEKIDLILIDEAHKALGAKTVEGMRNLFPSAVRIALTATPDYADDRSVTDEYGDKLISRSIVQAIEQGRVSPVRAFLYKTEATIDLLDPAVENFTVRELRRLAHFNGRNKAIVDMAEDLVSQGRQGLITTVPGENLLHAYILQEMLQNRTITNQDGSTRSIRARVLRGSDTDVQTVLEDFEDSAIDVLLYCDLLREGFSSDVASFLINGRPTTSIVNLTQDVGRILQPKGLDAIVADFLDISVKQQRTVYDVLELNRSTQGVFVGRRTDRSGHTSAPSNDTYLRDIFRPEIVHALKAYDGRLIADLHYAPSEKDRLSDYRERVKHQEESKRAQQQRKWEKILVQQGLPPEPSETFKKPKIYRDEPTIVIPVVPMDPKVLEESQPLVLAPESDGVLATELAATQSINVLRDYIGRLLKEAGLSQRGMAVIEARYGLRDNRQRTLREVGQEFGVTRERVRQLETKGLDRMRDAARRLGITAAETFDTSDWIETQTIPPLERWIDLANKPKPTEEPVPPAPGPAKRTWATGGNHIAANRQLMKERDRYYASIREVFGQEKADEDGSISERIVERVAEKLNYSRYDFVSKRHLVQTIGSVVPRAIIKMYQSRIQNYLSYAYANLSVTTPWDERERQKAAGLDAALAALDVAAESIIQQLRR